MADVAEVARVLREVQLDTEGGLVPARGSLSSRRSNSMVVKDDSATVGATKAVRKMALAANKSVGSFVGEIGVSRGNKEAGTGDKSVGSFVGEIDVSKENKEAGLVKASSWSDFLTTKTAAGAGNKTVAAVVSHPKPKEESKAEPEVSLITKERVPQCFIDRMTTYPSRKLQPSKDLLDFYYELFADEPEEVEKELARLNHWNRFVELEQDCISQYNAKGYAEVGVDYSSGVKQIFILPREDQDWIRFGGAGRGEFEFG